MKYLANVENEEIYLVPVAKKYLNNGSLAIILYKEDNEEFCSLTVNINEDYHGTNTAYVDSNNYSWIRDFIEDNDLGAPTGRAGRSGFCIYPEYKFKMEKLNKEK